MNMCKVFFLKARQRSVMLVALLFLAVVAFAVPAKPGDDLVLPYYQNADGKKGSDLKTAMCGIIFNRRELDYYKDLWEAYKTTDVRSDGKIWDMYSNITEYEPGGAAQGANFSKEGDSYNREHSFPKSWFGGEVLPMFSDLHHIYPTDGYINNRHSNYPFGETNGEKYKSANDFSKLGACTYPGYVGTVFEPNDEYKGDFARTYFYMVTCYEEKLPDWYSKYANTEVTAVLDGSTYPGLSAWQLQMLMKWAKNDPVSEKEINRNDAVYALQNNRNPFIDYPGLEEYVWGSMTNTEFSYDNYLQPVFMSFSLSETMATIGMDFTEPTLTTYPDNLTVTYSSSDETVATVDVNTGEISPVAEGMTTITATFAGNNSYNGATASYTLMVGDLLFAGKTLLYEGLSGYSSKSDSNAALSSESDYLDYSSWGTLTKVYSGGTENRYSNGGCLKFGSSGNSGSMTTGDIPLTGRGTLTFYLKKYSNDTGKLNVTVTGATADATQFTPSDSWTLCTVNLTNATGTVTITLATSAYRAYVDEITLTSSGTLNLLNNGNNTNTIAAAVTKGGKYDVTLKDRTLHRDAAWNTLTLPFALSAEQIAASDLKDADIRTLSTASFSGGTLTLNFTPESGEGAVTAITAGTPYIIKWANSSSNIVNPVFTGVTIDKTVRDKVCDLGGGNSVAFCGTYNKLTYDADDPTVLFLGGQDKLYYPESGATICAQRAYFQLTGIEASPNPSEEGKIRAFVLNFGEEAQGIKSIDDLRIDDLRFDSSAWYDMQGRKVKEPGTRNSELHKGLYIHNGKKVVIK